MCSDCSWWCTWLRTKCRRSVDGHRRSLSTFLRKLPPKVCYYWLWDLRLRWYCNHTVCVLTLVVFTCRGYRRRNTKRVKSCYKQLRWKMNSSLYWKVDRKGVATWLFSENSARREERKRETKENAIDWAGYWRQDKEIWTLFNQKNLYKMVSVKMETCPYKGRIQQRVSTSDSVICWLCPLFWISFHVTDCDTLKCIWIFCV